jgi:hypothetical protein
MILFRIAKPIDAKQIAKIHYAVRGKHPLGIFSQMNVEFLKQYYTILLNDPYEIIVCAENEHGKIVGFNSGTLDAQRQMDHLRKNKIRLGFSALPAIIKSPALLHALRQRYKATKGNNECRFVYTNGARGDFWAWSPYHKDPLSAVELSMKANAVFAALGITHLYIEVDTDNKEVLSFHKAQKAEIEQTIILPDGRERVLLKKPIKRK